MKKTHALTSSIAVCFFLILQSCSKNKDDNSGQTGTVTDVDGNVYSTITIGSQTWMTENLKTTRYNNGDTLVHTVDSADWDDLLTGAYTSYYDDVNTHVPVYGRLYNWHAAHDARNIAPVGWHVPSEVEWQTLINHLGGIAEAGGKMKTVSSLWLSPNEGADNSSGFSALPGGYRHYNGKCTGMSEQAYWWSSTARTDDDQYAYYFTLLYNYAVANENNNHKEDLMSLRCVKD